mgnify:CR=1 FL=1
MNNQLKRINVVVNDLKKRALQADELNKSMKCFTERQDKPLFNQHLFKSRSEYFIHYVNETENQILLTEKLINKGAPFDIYKAQLEHLEQQISALATALNANEAINKSSLQAKQQKQHFFKQKAKAVISSTQSLHQKLAETRGFERRLEIMLKEKEGELKTCTAKQADTVKQYILALHQRLGRCRQALSKLERQIELQEKRTLY